jgi:hypothetical protein
VSTRLATAADIPIVVTPNGMVFEVCEVAPGMLDVVNRADASAVHYRDARDELSRQEAAWIDANT